MKRTVSVFVSGFIQSALVTLLSETTSVHQICRLMSGEMFTDQTHTMFTERSPSFYSDSSGDLEQLYIKGIIDPGMLTMQPLSTIFVFIFIHYAFYYCQLCWKSI